MPDDDRLIYLLFTSQLKLRKYLKSAFIASGIKVTVAQSGILLLLKRKDGRMMTELSQILGIDNSTLTGLVDRLERSDFVKRNANPGDRRSSHIYITAKGLEEGQSAKDVLRRINEEIKAGFTPEEIDAFKKILQAFFTKFAKE